MCSYVSIYAHSSRRMDTFDPRKWLAMGEGSIVTQSPPQPSSLLYVFLWRAVRLLLSFLFDVCSCVFLSSAGSGLDWQLGSVPFLCVLYPMCPECCLSSSFLVLCCVAVPKNWTLKCLAHMTLVYSPPRVCCLPAPTDIFIRCQLIQQAVWLGFGLWALGSGFCFVWAKSSPQPAASTRDSNRFPINCDDLISNEIIILKYA